MRQRFRDLHADGLFVMPNPWDVGSARRLASLGFPALATTSWGFAASLGRADSEVALDELVAHVAALVAAVDVPVNVDAEHCFADVVETVERLAGTGAAGMSIEDWDPTTKALDSLALATERVGVAAEAARGHGIVLTARAENHLRGVDDLDDTLERLRAYGDAGADVVYAPALRRLEDIARVVELGVPVNVLAVPGGPTVAELAGIGVRRVSTGGTLARVAYDEAARVAVELRDGSA